MNNTTSTINTTNSTVHYHMYTICLVVLFVRFNSRCNARTACVLGIVFFCSLFFFYKFFLFSYLHRPRFITRNQIFIFIISVSCIVVLWNLFVCDVVIDVCVCVSVCICHSLYRVFLILASSFALRFAMAIVFINHVFCKCIHMWYVCCLYTVCIFHGIWMDAGA